MKKYEDLLKLHEENLKKIEKLKKDNAALREDIAAIKERIPGIAASGDVDSYMKEKASLERQTAQIEVNEAVIEALRTAITEDMAKEAWGEYYARMDKGRQAEYKKLDAMLDTLFEQYRKVANANLAMLQAKAKLARLAGMTGHGEENRLGFSALPAYIIRPLGEVFVKRLNGGFARIASPGSELYTVQRMNAINLSTGSIAGGEEPF